MGDLFSMKNKKIIVTLFFLFQLFSCQTKDNWNLKSYKTDNGWGYTISNSGKIYIKQSVIPVLSENKSFASEEDAFKIGDLVLSKLRAKKSPTVTEDDLKRLNIIGK